MDTSGGNMEETSSGARSELPLYLTCLPERYRTAKFSLAAYLLCWALLRWYQVRVLSYMFGRDILSLETRGKQTHVESRLDMPRLKWALCGHKLFN